MAALLHELEVYQVELELQNEELRASQDALLQERDYYARLFDNAPIGYVCLNADMVITRANLTVAALLGSSPDRLVNRAFAKFVIAASIDAFFAHRRAVLRSGGPETCQVKLASGGAHPVPVTILSLAPRPALDEPDSIRMVVVSARNCAVETGNAEPEEPLPAREVVEEHLRLVIRTLAQELANERKQVAQCVHTNVEHLVRPLLAQLKGRARPDERATIDAIGRALDELSSGFATGLACSGLGLTMREVQLCDLIRTGLSSKEIAQAIDRSPQSVDVHRRNIRRKLGITGNAGNLRTALQELAQKRRTSSGS